VLARSERELRRRLDAWMKQTGDVFRNNSKPR
jgi:hypothetical protein